MDELVQFQVNGSGIAVLGVLDEKHHQKGHNRCASVNDQLPGVGKVKDGTGDSPNQYDADCGDKSPAGAEVMRALGGKAAEPVGTSHIRRGRLNRFLRDLHGYFGSLHNGLRAVEYSAAIFRSCTRLAISASFAAG